jgi:hypothetical protein
MHYRYRAFYDGTALAGYVIEWADGDIDVVFSYDYRRFPTHDRSSLEFARYDLDRLTADDFPPFRKAFYEKLIVGDIQLTDELPVGERTEVMRPIAEWFREKANAPEIRELIDKPNAPRPGDLYCPKCGAQIYDSFGYGWVMHDPSHCNKIASPGQNTQPNPGAIARLARRGGL